MVNLDSQSKCPVCQSPHDTDVLVCQVCGAAIEAGQSRSEALPAETTLQAGAYTLESVLGEGGFGITYRATDTRLRRAVAIKEFFPAGCTRVGHDVCRARLWDTGRFATARRRFLEEARHLAQLDHAGIVDVYAIFEENATAYMVMELLEGATLEELLLSDGPLPVADAVRYVASVGECLETVHRAGFLHRDIKPSNIMLCPREGDDPRVVLIDFGSAREFAAQSPPGQTVTITPGFAPLEQYAHEARRGPFTDVYALAATFFFLVTGEAPPPASERAAGVEVPSLVRQAPCVGCEIAAVVEGAMAMEVERRPQSTREFVGLLETAGAGNPQSGFFKERTEAENDGGGGLHRSLAATAGRVPSIFAPVEKFHLTGHRQAVTALVFSPDGRWLASAGRDALCALWDIGKGEIHRSLQHHFREMLTLSFDSTGRTLCGIDRNGALHRWEMPDCKPLSTFVSRRGDACAAAFSKEAGLAAMAHRDGEMEIWDTGAAKSRCNIRCAGASISIMAFSTDNSRLAVACGWRILLFCLERGRLSFMQQLTGHSGEVRALAFSQDGGRVAGACANDALYIWDASSFELIKSLGCTGGEATHCGNFLALSFLPACTLDATGKAAAIGISSNHGWSAAPLLMAGGGSNCRVEIWDIEAGVPLGHSSNHRASVSSLAFAGDGAMFAGGSEDGVIRIWNLHWPAQAHPEILKIDFHELSGLPIAARCGCSCMSGLRCRPGR